MKKFILIILLYATIIVQGCSDDKTYIDKIAISETPEELEHNNPIENPEVEELAEVEETTEVEETSEIEEIPEELDVTYSTEFTNEWYKEYKYFESNDYEKKIELSYLDDGTIEVIIDSISAFSCHRDEYEMDSNSGYIYTDYFGQGQMIYYPDHRHSINVTYNNESKLYYPISETMFLDETNAAEDNTMNNMFSDTEVFNAARYYIYDAIMDTTYANYDWTYVKDVSVMTDVTGYTATFYIYSSSLKSYKYLRVHMGIDANGQLYFVNGGM